MTYQVRLIDIIIENLYFIKIQANDIYKVVLPYNKALKFICLNKKLKHLSQMGNQQGCCPYKLDMGDIQQQKSAINANKYGLKISSLQNKNNIDPKKLNKNIFTANPIQIQTPQKYRQNPSDNNRRNVSQQKQSKLKGSQISSQQFGKAPSKNQGKYSQEKQIQFPRNQNDLSQQGSEISFRRFRPQKSYSENLIEVGKQLQNLKGSQRLTDMSDLKKTLSSKSIIKQNNLRSEMTSKIKNRQQKEQQINIEYSPVVSKVISRLKLFQNLLETLPGQKIRKIKLNDPKSVYKGQINQNGCVLIGNFANGNIQGKAVYIYSNGQYYKGTMANNLANDTKGQFYSRNITYIGGFLNNYFHDQCEQLGDDYYFKGRYENNLRKEGSLSWQTKNQNKSNVQKADKSNIEQGLHENPSKTQYQGDQLPPLRDFSNIPKYRNKYQGSFDGNQLFTGYGTLKQGKGTYKGYFVSGAKQGKGQYIYSSQIRYYGDYQNGCKSGHGSLYNCDNTIAYIGSWKGGLPNGQGCSYDLQGNMKQAQFINGLNSQLVPQSQSLNPYLGLK